jgi:outer membrane protein OmpA-like peptidoglycan-associated protein
LHGQDLTLPHSKIFSWLVLLVTSTVTLPCLAQKARLHGELGIAHALGGHQARELGWGSTARFGAELVIAPEFGIVLQGSGTLLASGDSPNDATLKPLDTASGFAVGAGLQLRPFARSVEGGAVISPAGIWLGGNTGFMATGGTTRPMVDSGAGFDFFLNQGTIGLGPMVGWEHVFQPNDQLRPNDANILYAGIHGMFGVWRAKSNRDGDIDGDGIPDSRDQCRTVPEDKDNFEDEDGCPDVDNDQDTILDPDDKCPLVAEDHDNFEDQDGCPEADNDLDGILDVVDKCPNEPEDKDNFEDEDGCPDLDNDHDGIPDKDDLCPNEPETKNGYADEDGCPDSELIRVVGDKILLDDRVHFMINSRIIRTISYPLLTRLAVLINDHPEYIHIEVQGHTDERGTDSFNEQLSQSRADSVMEFLVARGVLADRLSAKGYSKSKPFVDKRNEYAYYMNRRVEFEITREVQHKHVADSAPNAQKPSTEPPLGSSLFHEKPKESDKTTTGSAVESTERKGQPASTDREGQPASKDSKGPPASKDSKGPPASKDSP